MLRLIRTSLVAALLIAAASASAQLNGTYTVGPTGTYTTLAAAITALQTNGVSGPVFMDLESGTHVGNWTLTAIAGASAVNNITFRSQALDSMAVRLYQGVSGPVLTLDGCAHVSFRHMEIQGTHNEAVMLNGTLVNVALTNNIFSQSAPLYVNVRGVLNGGGGLVLHQNRFAGGTHGVQLSCTGGTTDLSVSGSTFSAYSNTAININAAVVVNVERNRFIGTTGSNRPMNVQLGGGPLRIVKNLISGSSSATMVQVIGTNSPTESVVLENNMVQNTALLGGIMVLVQSVPAVQIVHNSIRSTQARVPLGMTGVSNASVLANILMTGNANTLTANGIGALNMDQNVLYNSQSNVANYNGTNYTWAAWQGAGYDVGGVFADPQFVGVANLHIQATSPAVGLCPLPALVTDDNDGDLRATGTTLYPDAGADERTDGCSAGLSGTYTIGPSSFFPTFTSAINTMVSCGISGPVVFEVADGTYTEQLVLPNIPGNSTTNTITFRGQSLDSSLVILTWPTGSGSPTVRMSGADRVTFEHMTIQRTGTATLPGAVVDWESTIADATTRSQYITFSHCRLISSATSNALSALVLGLAQNDENDVRILNCVMQGGHTGVRWNMNSLVSLTVRACVFSGQYNRAIACITPGASDPELLIENNIIQAPTFAGTTAVQVEHNSNLLRVTGNRITVPTSNGIGIDITCAGIDPYWTQVASNMVPCTGTARGIRMVGNNTGLGLYHNSVSTQFGYPLELPGTGTGNYMVGNAFRSTNTYMIYRSGTVTFAQADRNALFSPSANFVWWGAAVTDIAALRCLTGQQLNSIQADPLFVNNTTDLHLQSGSPCAGQSIFISGVDYDFDGELLSLPASTFPDIGADEINEDCTLIGGTYVIGPSAGADFATFTAAVTKLLSCGISGPVLFLVENGTYTEQIRLSAIKGSNSTNTVTFRGQALDSTTVILQYVSSAGATNNHVVANTGADHLRFEHMTLRRTGTQANARVVHLNPVCDAVIDMRVSHCVITNSSTGLLSADLVGRVLDAMPASFTIENCALQGGGYAVYSQPSSPSDTVSIVGCTRTGGTSGISLNLISGPITIRGNQLTATATDAVLVYQCTGAVDISRNRITGGTALTSSGIFIFGCQPVAPARIVVANNEIISTAGQGIRINGPSSRVDLVYNSVRTNGAFGTAMLAITGGSSPDTHIRNNIFSSTSYSAATVSLTGIAADRNVFWRTGAVGNAVQWNGVPYTTVTALAAGTGTNANSKFRDPLFYSSTTDLRSYSMEVDQAALPFAGIAVDKNGLPRHATTPDIGAFEFQPELWNEVFNTCGAADPILSTGNGQDQWIYKDRKVVARFNDNGQTLGLVNMKVYVHSGTVRQSVIGQRYMDRNWQLTTQNPITSGAIVRLFHSADEFAAYAAADPVVNVYADAGVAHYVGLMEDCNLPNNPAGNIWTPIFPASPALEPRIQGNGGTHGYTAVLANDGELYITTMGAPLPVELLSFTGERVSGREVLLHWTTATERNNAGFEVWRMIDGEEDFTEVSWVDGAGDSQSLIQYELLDHNATSRTSFYKLRQVDLDGQGEWSEVLTVTAGNEQDDIVLYPNPAHDEFFIRGDRGLWTQVQLIDAGGRMVVKWGPEERFVCGDLPPGIYGVSIQLAKGGSTHQRLLVR